MIQKEWVSDIIRCRHFVEKLLLYVFWTFWFYNWMIQDISDTEVNMALICGSSSEK